MVIRVLLRVFEQAFILSFLCTDTKALFYSLYKATEKLRFSVMEISGHLCSLSECHIKKINLQRFYCKFSLTVRNYSEVRGKQECILEYFCMICLVVPQDCAF